MAPPASETIPMRSVSNGYGQCNGASIKEEELCADVFGVSKSGNNGDGFQFETGNILLTNPELIKEVRIFH